MKIVKIIRNLCKRPNAANVHFHSPLKNLQPQTCGHVYKFHEEMHGHLKMLAAFRAEVTNMRPAKEFRAAREAFRRDQQS